MTDLDIRASLAGRLRSARERLGLRQGDVAERLGLPRSSVTDMESGKRDVSAAELLALSSLFGEPVDRLLGVRPEGDAEDLMFRAESVSEQSRAALGRWLSLCETWEALESASGDERRGTLRPVPGGISNFDEAEALADEERGRLELGPTPAHVLMDVVEERLGIKVLQLDLDDDLSGASVMSGRFGPAILLNRRHRPGRRVFTLAHELFHLVSHRPIMLSESVSNGSRRGWHVCAGTQPDGKDRVEQLADRFAGRLLMPPDHFIERLRQVIRPDRAADQMDLIGVARYFGVSVQAVFVQLALRRLVSWDLAMKAYRDPALHEGIVQAGPETGTEPKRFERLVMKAYLAERISRSRLAELLDLGIGEVDAALERSGARGAERGLTVALPR